MAFEASVDERDCIYLLKGLGGEAKPRILVPLLVSREIRFSNPRWSPDGRMLAFNAFLGGCRNDIYVLDLESGEYRPVVGNFPSGLLEWTPDGGGICFTVHWRVRSIKLDPARNGLDLSTDGSKAVVTADLPFPRFFQGMFLVSLASGRVEEVRGELKVGGKHSPRWSSDGRLIFFCGTSISFTAPSTSPP